MADTHEEFWGITLSGEKKFHTWNPASDEEEIEHKIQVTQACLGSKAKEGERNVVEVTTEDDNGRKISCAVVSLRVGFIECMHLELGFTNAVKFSLKEGSGPLSLCGIHLMALPMDLSDEEGSGSDESMAPQTVKSTAQQDNESPITEKEDAGKESVEVSKKQKAKSKTKKIDSNDTEAVMVVEEVDLGEKSKKRGASEVKTAVKAKKKKENDTDEDVVVVVSNGLEKKKKKRVALISDDSDEGGTDADEGDDQGDGESGSESTEELVLTQAKEVEDANSESGDEEPEFGDDIESEDEEDDEDDDSEGDEMADFIVEDDGMETDEDEDDDDDEDGDEDEDEDENDDSEDEDSQDSDEEVPQPPKKTKSSKTNGVDTSAKKQQEKAKAVGTPLKQENKQSAKKQTGKENQTEKTVATEKKEKKPSTPKRTPEELRTLLLKSPNLPKKFEKFTNFMKNNMKVADAKSQKELWEFVQKNKK